MTFLITDIPATMRRSGWSVGARLMERWFARRGRIMSLREKAGDTPPVDVEAGIVSWAWTMRFARARAARDRLLRTWTDPDRMRKSMPVIESRLRRWHGGVRANAPFRFGDLSAATAEVDVRSQVNLERVSSSVLGEIDDFYAAIGTGSIKIAVAGDAVPAARARIRLSIDEIGLYLRDTYDFIGDQPLGRWGPDGMTRFALLAPDVPIAADEVPGYYTPYFNVNNAVFNRYRQRFGKGGDYVIFSDVHRQRLARPIVLDFD